MKQIVTLTPQRTHNLVAGIYPRSAAQQSQNHCLRARQKFLALLRNPSGINPLATGLRSFQIFY
ncbi:hypothetical protein SOP89_09910 [Pseudomonas siliginis]|uniref:hypothetical protein n=1 Tax=Pseudomonas siliginis TaxID=2842346 RepID=UPI002B2413DF|nr:hypothetical protein [Pseudomonas siliginis]MEB2651689.1 hypothetical protein [Pseudomonas siliginis]